MPALSTTPCTLDSPGHASYRTMPLFSIVMPTYGVEDYISEAIACVRAQTCPDWELIVVDDCTPDRSADIARDAAREDKRIAVVSHPVNKGLSAARNTGIEHACGAYVWFPDPDDRYDERLLECAKRAIDEQPYDVVLFGHTEEYYAPDGSFQYAHPIELAEHRDFDQASLRAEVLDLEQATVLGYAWNKLYRLDCIRAAGLEFEDDAPLIEDIVFNVGYFETAHDAAFLPGTPYHYAKRTAANLTNKFVPRYFELHRRRIESIFEQQRRWGLDTPKARSTMGALFGRYILSALERNCDPRAGMSGHDRRAWCRRLFEDGLYRELIPGARASDSRALSLGLATLRTHSALLCTALGRLIHIARNRGGALFTKIKSER